MMRFLQVFTVVGLASLLAVSVTFGQDAGLEPGKITAIQVLPDGKRITLRSEGPVGRHSAFVIKNPYRLVVDFDSAALAGVPGKIKMPGDRIDEIRLGHANSRTRLVVDFGSRPVPPFKIDRGNGRIQVTLGEGLGPSDARVKPKAPQRPADRALASQKPPSQRPRFTPSGTGLVVKSAGVKDKLVFLELMDRSDPKSSYRLVVDLDPGTMLVKNATLSDVKGNVKRFELASKNATTEVATPQEPTSMRGPRKLVNEITAETAGKPKYKWGMPAVEQKRPAEARSSAESGPFRLERFRLEAKKSARES